LVGALVGVAVGEPVPVGGGVVDPEEVDVLDPLGVAVDVCRIGGTENGSRPANT